MDLNAIHYPDRPPDTLDNNRDPCPKLEDQAKISTTYRVHAQFGTSIHEILPHVLTVDTAAGLSLIDKTVLQPHMLTRIEPCSGVMLRCA